MKILVNKNQEYWNKVFAEPTKVSDDFSWLTQFPKYIQKNEKMSVLDIGCGSGTDSKLLLKLGYKVYAVDLSIQALKKLSGTELTKTQLNLEEGFPFKKNSFDLINASLSLHYFCFEETKNIIKNIFESLTSNGLFFGRFNSDKDFKFGVGKGDLISDDLYNVDGINKSFYNNEKLCDLFSTWDILHLEENEIIYFGAKKVLWEIIVRK